MKKYLLFLLTLFILWLYLYLIFFDTYQFGLTSTLVTRCNKKTGKIDAVFIDTDKIPYIPQPHK